jgi:hypothetical protein
MNAFKAANDLMTKQFGHDVIIALATRTQTGVNVRNVDGYYKDGAIYVLTHMASQKMKDIMKYKDAAICKDLMNAHGVGESLGNPKNNTMREELKSVFSAFYDRHVNEDDPLTCILKITLSSAVAFSSDVKYVIDYTNRTAESFPFVNDIVVSE